MKFYSKTTKGDILCRELTVAGYREMLKSNFGDQVDKRVFVENVADLLASITNNTIPYIKQMSILDVLYLILDVYSNSVGLCKITVTVNEQSYNVELNPTTMKNQLFHKSNLFSHTVHTDKFKILIEPPSLERSIQPAKYVFLQYITGIYTDKFIDIDSNEQALHLVETLTPKIANELANKYSLMMDVFSKINFLTPYKIENAKLNFFPTFGGLLQLTKLFFGDSLSNFYENFFHLSYTGNMSSSFLETMPMGEFNYFIGLLKNSLNTEPANADQQPTTINPDVGINESMFN